jgi:hypothetical protein
LHVRKEKGEIWAGGIHCFVAYYHRGAVLQIFFKDQYELMGTRIGLLTEKEDCPEEEIGNDIVAETAVSMKTTIIQNADDWLKVNKGNIDVLAKSMGNGVDKGIKWSGKTLFYNNAELHIYVPKENFTPQFKSEWIKKLSNYNSNINYEIVILENYIR